MYFESKKQQTIFEALQERFPDSSKRTLKNWLANRRVCLKNSVVCNPKTSVSSTDQLFLSTKNFCNAYPGLKIIFECPQYLVVEKPSNLLSVPLDTAEEKNALQLLRKQFPRKKIYPVHRLDREVSGLLLFVKGKENQRLFKKMFEQKSLMRCYIACVEGFVKKSKGTWRCHLKEMSNKNVVKASDGKEAITHFSLVGKRKKTTVLQLKLETGRKHQIRLHCSLANHPILGDKRYGAKISFHNRIALHAYLLSFLDPFTKKKKIFFSPPPKEFFLKTPEIQSLQKQKKI